MPTVTIINEDGSKLVLPSWDDADHVRDLGADPQALPLRDVAAPTLTGLLADLRDHVLANCTPEQRQQILDGNPRWREALSGLANTATSTLAQTDDDLAALVIGAADVVHEQQTEPCADGAKQRAVLRQWSSPTVGYRVVERVQYQDGPDSPRCFAESGRTREVATL